MFLIYINELIDILVKFGVKVKMFANDAKMYLHVLRITDDIDAAQPQQAVDALINICGNQGRLSPLRPWSKSPLPPLLPSPSPPLPSLPLELSPLKSS